MTREVPTYRIPDVPWLTTVTPGKLKRISTFRQEGKTLITSIALTIGNEAVWMSKYLPQSSKGLRLEDFFYRNITETDIKRALVQMAVEEMSKPPGNEASQAIFETLDTSAVIRAVKRQQKYFSLELVPSWYYLPARLTKDAEDYPRSGSLREHILYDNNLVFVTRYMHNLVRERTNTIKGGFFYLVSRPQMSMSEQRDSDTSSSDVGYRTSEIEVAPSQSLDYEGIVQESRGNHRTLQRSLSIILARRGPTQAIDFCTSELQGLYPSLDEAEKEALERGRQRFHQFYRAYQARC